MYTVFQTITEPLLKRSKTNNQLPIIVNVSSNTIFMSSATLHENLFSVEIRWNYSLFNNLDEYF